MSLPPRFSRWIAWFVLAFLVQSCLLISCLDKVVIKDQDASVQQAAHQLAVAATPLLLGHDLLGLSVLTQQMASPPVLGEEIMDMQGNILTGGGRVFHQGLRNMDVPIITQGQRLGTIRMYWQSEPEEHVLYQQAGTLLGLLAIDITLLSGILLSALPLAAGSLPLAQPGDTPAALAVSRLHIRLDDTQGVLQQMHEKQALPSLQYWQKMLEVIISNYGGNVVGGLMPDGMWVDFEQSDPVERQMAALSAAMLILERCENASAHPMPHLRMGLVHGLQSHSLQLKTCAARLSQTAPAGCLLMDDSGMLPLLAMRSEVDQTVRINLGADLGIHRVLRLHRLKPEFQALIKHQAQQLRNS
ncbi:MAG: hypothetical protein HKM02_08040 [Pseudomonadales bacterium]|nr:hypothetical protein [Pseudomonadales bacterium]